MTGARTGWDAYHRQMEQLLERRDLLALRRLDLVLLATAGGLLVATAIFLSTPSLSFSLLDRSADMAINSLSFLAASSLAALALARYRESGRVAGLFQSSAFLVMAWLAGLNMVVVGLRVDFRFGLTLGLPEQLPLLIWSGSRLLAAALLVVGGVAALGALGPPPKVRRTLLAPILGMTIVTFVLFAIREILPGFDQLLPQFLGPEGILAMIEESSRPGAMPGLTPIGAVLQATAAGLFLGGALLYRRSYLRNGPVADGYLAVALLLSAIAEIHFAIYPGVYSGLVTSGDALRLASFVVLLLGINAESRADLRALRAAYAALERLRMSETERATLEERTRLARELHDGLSQDLWFAKLKHERLVPHVPKEQRGLAAEVTQALDAAIAEAKQALVTMRAGIERDRPLQELLSEAVEDFGSRSGLLADFSAADLPASLPPRTQVEVLRVLQEALTNVRKHADATVVRVSAEVEHGMLKLRVVDNGRGFWPDESSGDGLGVQGMKERARLMGGELEIVSEPSSGTGVHLAVPVVEGASPA